MHKTKRTVMFVGLAAMALGLLPVLAGAGACNSKSTFYVPQADKGATQQIVSLLRKHDFKNAVSIAKMVSKGHAVWFTSGTPADVQKQAKKTMRQAHAQHAVPVLVAYDLPFRDCGQYSAGGALNTPDYLAWIDGLAKGIGDGKATVILEPDGLGIIPYSGEWCKPDLTGAELTEAEAYQARFDQLNGAVDRLELQPNVSVYLDATHSAWQNVSQATKRLRDAGVNRAQGFFLNVSNYQYTANSIQYGTWISSCVTLRNAGYGGDCPDQYYNGWSGTGWAGSALSAYGVWSDSATDSAFNTTGENMRYADALAGIGATATTHFVIDTSRNGLGPWTTTVSYPDKQDWCNPPGRGLGIAPTTDTGNVLVDAYLWLKVPGESDGSCNRGVSGSTTDPEWGGIVDPAAGEWFPEMALQLAQNANPVLK
jgi:endoglucanase